MKDDLKQKVVKVGIRCSNYGKETVMYVENFNKTYQDIITTFVLNKMLHHVGMLRIIENYEDLKYDMDIQNSYWLAGSTW